MPIDPDSVRWDAPSASSPVRRPPRVIPLPPSAADKVRTNGQVIDSRRTEQAIGIDAAKNRRDDLQLQADLAAKGLRVGRNGAVEAIPNWRPPAGSEQTAVRSGMLRDRVTAMQNLEASLRNVQTLYDRNFRGSPVSRLGGLSEFVPQALNAKNQEFNSAALRLGPFIQNILGLGPKEADAASEYERKVMPFIPKATDFDNTNESKIAQLWEFLNTQRSNTHREIGLPPPARAAARQGNTANVIHYDAEGNRLK